MQHVSNVILKPELQAGERALSLAAGPTVSLPAPATISALLEQTSSIAFKGTTGSHAAQT